MAIIALLLYFFSTNKLFTNNFAHSFCYKIYFSLTSQIEKGLEFI